MSAMRVDPRFLNWGVFFILLGAIPLAVSQGWIPDDAVDGWWRFWPLILIGIGVGLLLRRTPFHFVGGLIVAATFGLMFGSLLAGGVAGRIAFGFSCTSDRSGTAFADQTGTLGPSGSVSPRDELRGPDRDPDRRHRLDPDGDGPDGRAPQIDAVGRPALDPGTGALLVRLVRQRRRRPGASALPTDPTLDLSTTLNAGTRPLSLAGMHLDDYSGTTNAGETTIDFTRSDPPAPVLHRERGLDPDHPPGRERVRLGHGQRRQPRVVCPAGQPDCGSSRARSSARTTSARRGSSRPARPGRHPATPRRPVQIDLSISANAGSVELDPAGGCR